MVGDDVELVCSAATGIDDEGARLTIGFAVRSMAFCPDVDIGMLVTEPLLLHDIVIVAVAAVIVTVDGLLPELEQSVPAVVTVTVAEGEHTKLDPDDATAVTVMVLVTVVVGPELELEV